MNLACRGSVVHVPFRGDVIMQERHGQDMPIRYFSLMLKYKEHLRKLNKRSPG
jgi:hypothetical protein